jgi:hypothetical protein
VLSYGSMIWKQSTVGIIPACVERKIIISTRSTFGSRGVRSGGSDAARSDIHNTFRSFLQRMSFGTLAALEPFVLIMSAELRLLRHSHTSSNFGRDVIDLKLEAPEIKRPIV